MWSWLRSLVFRRTASPVEPAAAGPVEPAAADASPAAPVAGPAVDDVHALLDRWARLSQQGLQPGPRDRELIHAAYDAAQSTFALKNHWQMSDALSADAANSPSVRKTLRERSRYESTNNSYLCGMARTIANDVVGRGPRLQMLTGNERVNNRVERLWKAWAKEIKLAKKLRLARQTQVRDGEVFLLFTTNDKLRSPIKLDLQVIECDQVEDYFFIPTPEQPVSGMVLDKGGNPLKYHVLKTHPGSAVLWANNPYEFDVIDAEFVIHLFKADRPGQHRGVPECVSSLSLFAILRSYTMSVLDAARIAGTLNYGIGTRSNQIAPAKISSIPAFTPLAIPAGTVPLFPEGWEPFQMDMQKPVTGYGEFANQIINEAARPVHMPRNIATGNSSDYNFSSAKMDKATYYAAIGIDQEDMATDVLDPIWLAFLTELEALGELDVLDGEDPLEPFEEWEHEWEFDAPDPIDEQKSAAADQINLTTGKLSLGPSDLVRMEQTARCLGLTLQQYQQAIVRQAFAAAFQIQAGGGLQGPPGGNPGEDPGAAGAAAVTPGGNPGDGTAPAGGAAAAGPGGELATASRMQWLRNRKGFDDVLDEYAVGKVNAARALLYLQMLGLTPATAQALLQTVSAPETNPVPTGGNTGVTT